MCQDRAICVRWAQLGWVWAELDTGKGFQSVRQGGSHHAELHGHQHSVCSQSKCVSLTVLETCPSVQEPLWGTAQPLWALAPCTACTGS